MLNLTVDQLLPYITVAIIAAVAGAVGTSATYRALWRACQKRVGSPLLAAMLVGIICVPVCLIVFWLLFGHGEILSLALAVYWPSAIATLWLESERRLERTRAIKLWRNQIRETLLKDLRAALGSSYTFVIEVASVIDLSEPDLNRGDNLSITSRDGILLVVLHFAADDFMLRVRYPNTAYVSYRGDFAMTTRDYRPEPGLYTIGNVVGEVKKNVLDYEASRTQRVAEAAAAERTSD